ncbi:LETM1-like protein [Rhizoctonia solani AG-3 Rhs1AP]|uniref:LETM1-like protein n=1 Tax=Rhizoctonia solani AG-3 Rhs1AP TaxID=1086054 RepID=X8JJJ0_9AGAM|nr:LETM1-like protein [Rhizoctonia solani AG-3 Rhs1AP]
MTNRRRRCLSQQPASQSPKQARQTRSSGLEKPPSKIKMAIADVVKAAELGALAPPPPDASKLGKLWHQVKELFKFYVRGLKQLLVHRQIVKDLKARGGKMTWEEAHFVKTYKEDTIKLIPFLLILLILEEALPLVVLYAPFLLPSTCILPNQRARILWKRDDAQFNARSEARSILLSVGSLQKLVEGGIKEMPVDLVAALAKVFGLSTRGPVALQRRRLEKHLEYLINDDRLLVSDETMGSHLDLRNLKIAMSERGFLASADESHLRTTLDKRLHALGEDAAEWKPRSLQFLLQDVLESKKDVKPAPVD